MRLGGMGRDFGHMGASLGKAGVSDGLIHSDIIMPLIGQSNEHGFGSTGELLSPNDDPVAGIYEWRFADGTFQNRQAVQVLGFPQNVGGSSNAPGTNGPACPGFQFANGLKALQAPGFKIILLPCAYDNTGILSDAGSGTGRWNTSVSTPGDLYTSSISTLQAALAYSPNALVICSWTQGEADNGNTWAIAQGYLTALLAVIDGFRAAAPNCIFTIGSTLPEAMIIGASGNALPEVYITRLSEQMRLAQYQRDGVIFVSADTGLDRGDHTHFTSAGWRANGVNRAALVSKTRSLVGKTPGACGPISFSVSSGVTSASFAAPSGGFCGFRVEFRPVGGTVWSVRELLSTSQYFVADGTTGYSRFVAPGGTVTFPVPYAGEVDVRVSARTFTGYGPTVQATTSRAGGLFYDNTDATLLLYFDTDNGLFAYNNGSSWATYASEAAMVSAGIITSATPSYITRAWPDNLLIFAEASHTGITAASTICEFTQASSEAGSINSASLRFRGQAGKDGHDSTIFNAGVSAGSFYPGVSSRLVPQAQVSLLKKPSLVSAYQMGSPVQGLADQAFTTPTGLDRMYLRGQHGNVNPMSGAGGVLKKLMVWGDASGLTAKTALIRQAMTW